jgi:hypothetical protein
MVPALMENAAVNGAGAELALDIAVAQPGGALPLVGLVVVAM